MFKKIVFGCKESNQKSSYSCSVHHRIFILHILDLRKQADPKTKLIKKFEISELINFFVSHKNVSLGNYYLNKLVFY